MIMIRAGANALMGFQWDGISLVGEICVSLENISSLLIIISRRRRRDIGLLMSVRPSVRSHYYVTAERNFIKLILNMYYYNDVMHVKFGPAGLGSS